LPFEGEAFQAVLSLGTALGYLGEEGDRAALREFRRVLAPGGRLVIETLHREEIGVRVRDHEERPLAYGSTLWIARRFDRARGLMHETQRLQDGTAEVSPSDYDLRVYGQSELCRMLEGAGFTVIARHASLSGEGEPSPATPLVLVAEASRPRAPARLRPARVGRSSPPGADRRVPRRSRATAPLAPDPGGRRVPRSSGE
jgi:hypothetical protein